MYLNPRWTNSICLGIAPGAPRVSTAGRARPTPTRSGSEPVASSRQADHLTQIRERLRAGWYASPHGIDALATCLLASGVL